MIFELIKRELSRSSLLHSLGKRSSTRQMAVWPMVVAGEVVRSVTTGHNEILLCERIVDNRHSLVDRVAVLRLAGRSQYHRRSILLESLIDNAEELLEVSGYDCLHTQLKISRYNEGGGQQVE